MALMMGCTAEQKTKPVHSLILDEERQTTGAYVPFVENRGQWDKQVAYKIDTPVESLWVTHDQKLVHQVPVEGGHEIFVENFEGPKHQETPKGVSPLKVKASYLLNASSTHSIEAPSFGEINMGEVWDGVEVHLKSDVGTRNIEKFFYVHPGTNPGQIRVSLKGNKQFFLDETGALLLYQGQGKMSFSKPVAFQLDDRGNHIDVEVEYILQGNTYSFEVGKYDHSKVLVIDPILQSTFMGGPNALLFEDAYGLTIDTSGHVILVGVTGSRSFPGTSGGYQPNYAEVEMTYPGGDIFIAKLSADLRTLIQATYVGTGGGFTDAPLSKIIQTSDGNYAMAIMTEADAFPGTIINRPVMGHGIGDVLLIKLSQDLSTLNSAMYLGSRLSTMGFIIPGENNGSLIQLPDGTFAFGTTTRDPLFINTEGGIQESIGSTYGSIVLSHVNQNLNVVLQSTYLDQGGTQMFFSGISASADGKLIVVGSGSNFSFSAVYAYKANISLQGTFEHVMISGSGSESSLAEPLLDAEGNVYICGVTHSTDFPKVANGFQTELQGLNDVFLAKLSLAPFELTQSTLLGGTGQEHCTAMAFGPSGEIVISGMTDSSNFPSTFGGAQSRNRGQFDFVLASLSSDLKRVNQSTYLGGSGVDANCHERHGPVRSARRSGLVLDGDHNWIMSGSLNSSSFPGTNGGYLAVPRGMILSKITPDLSSCGNGIIDESDVCDGNLLGTGSCESELGAGAYGNLRCNAQCQYEYTECTYSLSVSKSPSNLCVLEGAVRVPTETTSAQGDVPFMSTPLLIQGTAPSGYKFGPTGSHLCGQVACTNPQDCTFDLGVMDSSKQCIVNCKEACGDGIVDLGEACDGMSVPAASCVELGYAGGSLECNPACQYNEAECFHQINITKTGDQAETFTVQNILGGALDCGTVCEEAFFLDAGPAILLNGQVRNNVEVAWIGCDRVEEQQCVLDIGWTGLRQIQVEFNNLDDDGDLILDSADNCAAVYNPTQSDINQNGQGDLCDGVKDTDGDSLSDVEECPETTFCPDSDGDGRKNFNDDDDDGDGLSTRDEVNDATAAAVRDHDIDNLENWLDTDADADGVWDQVEGREDRNQNGRKDYLEGSYPGKLVSSSGCCRMNGKHSSGDSFLFLMLWLLFVAKHRARASSVYNWVC